MDRVPQGFNRLSHPLPICTITPSDNSELDTLAYEGIRTQIALTNQAVRSAIRGVLQAKGFRSISDVTSMVAVHDSIEAGHVDLVIASTHLGYDETPLLIKEMRNQRLGSNPFVVVMLLLENADPDLVRSIVSTGTDDLLVMPVAPGQVISRVEGLTRARKRFVVTHDYIGPDRRKAERPGTAQAASFEPPNPMALRSTDIMDEGRFRQLIKTGSDTLNRIAISVQARQLGWLYAQISTTGHQTGAGDTAPVQPRTRAGHAAQMVNACQEIARRMHPDLAQSHLPAVTEVMELGQKVIGDPVSPNPEHMDRIRVLTSFLSQEFKLPI